jgi:pyrimidine-nucleoside phosphorylase
MSAVDLIRQKRDGAVLSAADIRAFVEAVTSGAWPDYQIAAMLMAIVLRGMSLDEAVVLTDAMVRSGATLDFTDLAPIPVDKHSTGGVGDKTSLVLAPLAAAAGVLVPMMSGRGLGHTGGTLDKLESIPGFRTGLSRTEMRRVLALTGCALVGQTDDIAPADRRLYALRDVTATVESVPLICASILSKKIAEGARALVLDVKVGCGAFMKTTGHGRELAGWLVDIAARHGVRVEAVLTPMNAPLGRSVGNACEVAEAVATLRGEGPRDVEDLSVLLAARMVHLAGLEADATAADARVRRVLESGAGLEKLSAIVEAQGGDPRALDDPGRLPRGRRHHTIPASRAGFVTWLDAEMIGRAAVALGAGRERAEDAVDHGAGIEIVRPRGAEVRAGDPVLVLSADDPDRLERALALAADAVELGDEAPDPEPLVIESLTSRALAHD